MKKRILTLALVVLFTLTLVPLVGGTTVAATPAGLEKVALPAISVDSGANNNEDTQMGWATEGFEDEDTVMDVPSDVAFRAMFLALEMPEAPGFLQFILQTPAGWWQQIDYDGDALAGMYGDDGVLRLPFLGDWDMDDIRCKFLLGFYDDGVLDLGITDQWLEVYPEVNEGDLFEIRLPDPKAASNNNEDTQIGWATNGFEDEGAAMDVPAPIALRATHLVLEMPEAPGFLQFILQTPDGWWQQTDMDGDTLAGYWDDATSRLSIPFEGDWAANDIRAKFLLGYYDDGVMDLGITGVWLLIGPEVVLGEATAPRELPPVGSLPLDIGVGHAMWGDEFTQLGWNGDTRAIDNKMPFDGGGLTAGLFAEANFFVIYVDNAPDDEVAEMIKLGVFGNANGWGWEAGALEAPTVMIYDADLGAIVFPIGGHPYLDAVRAAGEDELENRNFAIYFEYDGGIENLGITRVVLYAELPSADAPPPPPVDPPPPPPENIVDDVVKDVEGFAWWVWALIGVGVVAVVVVIVIIVKKKG